MPAAWISTPMFSVTAYTAWEKAARCSRRISSLSRYSGRSWCSIPGRAATMATSSRSKWRLVRSWSVKRILAITTVLRWCGDERAGHEDGGHPGRSRRRS